MLLKIRIAFSLCHTDLIDDYVAVVLERALLLPLCRRAREAAIAHPACVEEVFRAVSGIGEELLGKRPRFAADLALPPGHFRFAPIQFRTSSP